MQNIDKNCINRPERLQLRLFGPPQISLDGAPFSGITSAKALGLLYYLAVTQQSHPRLILAALLWGELSESAAQGNLRKALQQLRKHLGAYLIIERKRVALAENSDCWVDAVEFDGLLNGISEIDAPDRLQQAIDLYRGDFLEGFYLHNAPEFENWWLSHRARLREKMLDALHTLSDHHAEAGQLEQAIALTRRYLELEPWREGAHRRLMDFLARSGQRSAALAQFEICRQILADELAVEPAQEIIDLYERIRAGTVKPHRIEAPPDKPAQITAAPSAANIPQIPHRKLDQPPLFVGREGELDQLDEALDRSLAGQSQFIFISGEPGLGKTALMNAFARRALKKNAGLTVAQGNCSAFSGQGDPYLPFRELLNQLTGDVAGQLSPPPLADAHAQRLLNIAPITMQHLVAYGSFLVNTLVPSKPLLERARQLSQGSNDWFEGFQDFIDSPILQEVDLQQSAVFEQFANLLQALAVDHPLLILLDDLHWADQGSLHLLAHLGRRLTGSRVLVIGAYRPEEISLHPDGERHPLIQLLNDFKRQFGRITIDLQAGDQDSARAFVDAVLDAQPNEYGEIFRSQFYQRTQGHPLFTVELLRSMQTRGDLTQDPERGWVPRGQLNWEHIPARVEAVIAERAGRLDDSLHGLLALASVEGEVFTAQVIAQVENLSERTVLQDLFRGLVSQHYLLRESGEIEIQGRYLNRYRFTHALYQEYFYKDLSAGERRLLHAEVAGALEEIYKEQSEQIATNLARHYQEARNPQKAAAYFQMAGDRAVQLSGYEEACSLFSNALSTLDVLPVNSENEKLKIKNYLKLGEARYLAGQLAESMETFERAATIAKSLGSAEDFTLAALGYENSRWRFNLPVGATLTLLEEALKMLGDEDSILRTRVWTSMVRSRKIIDSAKQISMMTQKAVEMARRVDDPEALYEALYLIIWGNRRPAYSDQRLSALDEMKSIAKSMGDMWRLQDVNGYLSLEYLERGDINSWKSTTDQHEQLIKKLQQPFYLWINMTLKALQLINEGHFDKAETKAQEAYAYGQVFSIDNIEGVFGLQMFTIRREQGRLQELAPILEAFMAQRSASQTWQPGLALLYCELERRNEAAKLFYELAKNDFEAIPVDSMWLTSISYLAEVCAYLGDQDQAQVLYELLKPYDGRTFFAGFLEVNFGAASRFLGLLAMTCAHWDIAEKHLQDALSLNQQIEAWTWLAHTQTLYAVLLLTRPPAMGQPDDRENALDILVDVLRTTQDLGMAVLENIIKSLIEKHKGE